MVSPSSSVLSGVPQPPPTQLVPTAQTTPQAPQLFGSKSGLVQRLVPSLLVQSLLGSGQLDAHLPAEQASPVLQTVPHAPQFFGSFCVSKQDLSHFVSVP